MQFIHLSYILIVSALQVITERNVDFVVAALLVMTAVECGR